MMMKKKLLVLLIAVIPSLMPNLASAVAIDVGEIYCVVVPNLASDVLYISCGSS